MVFDDKRIMVGVIWTWLIVVLAVFTEMGLFKSDFVRWGPSPTTVYIGIKLDNWYKWSAVAIFTAISSFMNDLAGESLEPFFLMVIRDHKTRYIPYSKTTSVLLNQLWSVYCSIMSVFGLYTFFAQADLLVIKMLVGLIVNMYSSWRYMRNKKYEPFEYQRYFDRTSAGDDASETTNVAFDASDRCERGRVQSPRPIFCRPAKQRRTPEEKLVDAVAIHVIADEEESTGLTCEQV